MIPFESSEAVERLELAFAELLAETEQGGAALSLFQGERCLLSLHGGEASSGLPWNRSTPCLIWSASKGVASSCTLHALQTKEISLKSRVAEIWPEFAANGKERITFAQLLSHSAGLASIDQKGIAITDHEAVVGALAAQASNWKLDEKISNGKSAGQGYGARTFGFLLDEIVRRISGMTLSDYWEEVFCKPFGLDIWFGLSEDRLEDAATVIAPKTPPASSDFSRAFGDPTSLTRRALSEPGGILTPSLMNTRAMRMASIPSLGAIATADSLARFYAYFANPDDFFNRTAGIQMQTTLASGRDRVLLAETSFSAGLMTNDFGVYGSGTKSFGHPGAGGSLGFADPELGIGFAFIPSAMHPGALPGARTRKLVHALYGTTE